MATGAIGGITALSEVLEAATLAAEAIGAVVLAPEVVVGGLVVLAGAEVYHLANSKSKTVERCPERDPKDDCKPGDCEEAKATIRDLLKNKHKTFGERLEDLRTNPQAQPYEYPVDPATGKEFPSEGGTIKGHLQQIIQDTIRGNKAIQKYYQCECEGLDPEEVRRLGDQLLEDPLEGWEYKEPNYTTPAERDAWRVK
jgi:hypothetical protein